MNTKLNEALNALRAELEEAKALPVGTKRKHADGKTYEKQSDGSWVQDKMHSEHGLHAVGEHGKGFRAKGGGFFAVFRPKGSKQIMTIMGTPFKTKDDAKLAAQSHLDRMREYGSPAAPARKK